MSVGKPHCQSSSVHSARLLTTVCVHLFSCLNFIFIVFQSRACQKISWKTHQRFCCSVEESARRNGVDGIQVAVGTRIIMENVYVSGPEILIKDPAKRVAEIERIVFGQAEVVLLEDEYECEAEYRAYPWSASTAVYFSDTSANFIISYLYSSHRTALSWERCRAQCLRHTPLHPPIQSRRKMARQGSTRMCYCTSVPNTLRLPCIFPR